MERRMKDKKPFIFFSIGILAIAAIVIAVFYSLYQVSRNNLISMWSNNAMQLSRQVEHYLDKPGDAVIFSAKRVEEMIKEGKTNAEIGAFLTDETRVYASLIESNSTGVYGYCRGEYLDGSGWTPPDGYIPTERPWYTVAVQADGELAFVKPYQNAQTGTMTMSISKLLEDKESVVSMDIHLDSIQRLEESIPYSGEVDVSMVLDKSGIIVAHSDKREAGKDYLNDGDELQKQLVSMVFEKKEGVAYIDGYTGRDILFCDQINNEWYSVLILNESDVLGRIRHLYFISAAVLVAVVIIFFVNFVVYLRKHRQAGELESEISAISDIYSKMEMLDLVHRTAKPLKSSNGKPEIYDDGDENINATPSEVAKAIASESSRNILEQFLNLETLSERMRGLKSISHEYIDNMGKWNRMHFIAVEREEDGNINKVIWAVQSIDEDKKRQEQFKNLAETDGLTHILNRTGGESRIFERLEKGKLGMLMVLDADHFKYVNDTYGHEMGDKVIIALANTLKETFRDSDVVYRLGGDEFVAFATGVESKEIGRLVVGRLFERMGKTTFDGMKDWSLNTSVGAVILNNSNKEPFNELLQRADKAMYLSKQHEGNYLTFADSEITK